MKKIIIWADGQTQQAQEITIDPAQGFDVESAATFLGCEIDEVNQCAPGEVAAYGVSLASDPFQAPKGLAR